MEKLKRNSGITLTMLAISVVVMLIIASILTYVSMNNENLMVNAEHTKFKETVTDLEAKVKQKIILKEAGYYENHNKQQHNNKQFKGGKNYE